MTGLVIRRATPEDVPEVIALARRDSSGPAWPEEAFQPFVEWAGEMSPQRLLLVARDAGGVLRGWLAATLLDDTSELELVLVEAEARGRGIGRALAVEWLRWAEEQGGGEALLEARASNVAALGLYRALGFAEQGTRKAYYRDPLEDAVLMRTALTRTSR